MKPILFNTPMVRAIQDGRKHETRRVIRFKPGMTGRLPRDGSRDHLFYPCGIKYPPYQPGDVLYVRETWAKLRDWTGADDGFLYRADWNDETECPRWHPSIHMPKEAARIFLRVTKVWVERLQDMTMNNMRAEGMIPTEVTGGQWQQWQRDYAKPLWNSTVKKADLDKYGWDANPWVWVTAFRRVEKEEI